MRVAAVIPWRGGQPDRERHHQRVRAHLRQLLPDAIHIDADSGHQPFSRAGSRNLGVELARNAGADIVVLCDADTLVQPEPLYAAINAAQDQVLHLPFTRWLGLSRAGLRAYENGTPLHKCETEYTFDNATGSVLVITPAAWWRAGGMDERYRGWGMEDVAFRCAADTLLGPTIRHDGTAHHLWHPITWSPHTPEYQHNAALLERYQQAVGNPAAMRALITGDDLARERLAAHQGGRIGHAQAHR